MSTYETKPGNGVIFRNEKKQDNRHPDYTGSIVTPSGEELRLSLWVKESQQTKKKYFSVAVSIPSAPSSAPSQQIPEIKEEGYDLPF